MNDDGIIKRVQEHLTPESHLEQLHDLLRILIETFDQHGIFYMAMAGTLLGIVRNNNYIPWDDDIDLAINYKDYDKLMNLNEHLRYYNIEITGKWDLSGKTYTWEDGKPWKLLKFRYIDNHDLFIDLFPFINEDGEYKHPPLGRIPKSWYTRNVFKISEMYPTQMLKLRDINVVCPRDPVGFVKRSYGEDAIDTCVITHQHLKKKGMLKNAETKIEQWLGLGVYDKEFSCHLFNEKTINQMSSEEQHKLKWLHWALGLAVVICVVLLYRVYPSMTLRARA